MTTQEWVAGGGETAVIFGLVQLAKKFAPKLVLEREAIFALVAGLVVGVAARLLKPGLWEAGSAGWIASVGTGLAAALASGLTHDKAWNPMIEFLVSVLTPPKKEIAATPLATPAVKPPDPA